MNKSKFFRSLNNENKFCGIINEKQILDNIFDSKKSKQRYLDYVYKITIKNGFKNLQNRGLIDFDSVENLYFFVDEHTTATNGRYELREALEKEFKNGTFNYNYKKFFPPIFPNLNSVNLKYCDSSLQPLIRASDIIANRVFYLYGNNYNKLLNVSNMSIKIFP